MSAVTFLERARSVLEDDRRAIASAAASLGQGFVHAVSILLEVQGKTLVTGMGTSGAVARRIAHLLSCGGTPAVFVSAADGLHGGLGLVAEGDVLISISKGGESEELNDFTQLARERGARVIVMTEEANSSLAAHRDCVIEIHTPPDTDPGHMLAMGSTIAASAVGDALALILMQERGYGWDRFEMTHPGGAVGKAIDARG
jgi:D-arabinose 5-phosphate isomerase GutQ